MFDKKDKEYIKRVAMREYQNNTSDLCEAYLRGFEAALHRKELKVVNATDYCKMRAHEINNTLRTYDGKLSSDVE